MAFIDRFEHTLDDRGRVAIPARYRPMFAEGVVLVRGSERCIEVYTPQDFRELSRPIMRASSATKRGRRLKRGLYPNCHQDELDNQGRILLPATFREWAGLDSTVIIFGRGDCLELWSPQRWEEEQIRVAEAWSEELEDILEPPE
jgi:MraZ protein